jgi:hypothetical protein
MNNKHRKTLADVFTSPVPADIPWTDIIKLFIALGGTITQVKGSRVRVFLNDQRAVFMNLTLSGKPIAVLSDLSENS